MEKGVIFSNKDGVFKRLPNGAIIPYKDGYNKGKTTTMGSAKQRQEDNSSGVGNRCRKDKSSNKASRILNPKQHFLIS